MLKRAPSISSRPPWRSAVARTSASPRPEPGCERALLAAPEPGRGSSDKLGRDAGAGV